MLQSSSNALDERMPLDNVIDCIERKIAHLQRAVEELRAARSIDLDQEEQKDPKRSAAMRRAWQKRRSIDEKIGGEPSEEEH